MASLAVMVQSFDMPKAVLTDSVEKPKRAPRKRAAPIEGEVVKVPRKRTPRKVITEDDVSDTLVVSTVSQTRKAPTLIGSEIERKKTQRTQSLIISGVILVGFAVSAVVGFSDSGKIDINATIASRNAELSPDGSSQLIPVQNTSQEPDGGLIGLGDTPISAEAVSTTTASTTDQSASSTESVASSTPVGNVPMNEPDISEPAPVE